MSSPYIERTAQIGKMTRALRKHLLTWDALDSGTKRQAAYIIEDIDPGAAVNLDPEALKLETIARELVQKKLR